MQITDEMVEKAVGLYEAMPPSAGADEAMRAALEAVAPLIAKAEAEEIAAMADDNLKCISCGHVGIWKECCDRMNFGGADNEELAAAIRARHATPTEKIDENHR